MNASEHLPPLLEYDFERSFDERPAIEWMKENWSKSFVFSALYAAVIFGGQQFMKERQKLELRKPLVLWSVSLAVFSIIGAVRTGWYMLYIVSVSLQYHQGCADRLYHRGCADRLVHAVHCVCLSLCSIIGAVRTSWSMLYIVSVSLQYHRGCVDQLYHQGCADRLVHAVHCVCLSLCSIIGAVRTSCIIGAVRTGWYMLYILDTSGFKQSVCDQSFYSGPVSKFWAYAFVLSKAPELGDTVFIVLRKQRLIFLHWYHHITVLLYSWYSYKDRVAGGGWFMTMNYLAHALMYSYYAARAAGVRVPRPLAMLITTTQIAQMVMGLVVSGLVFFWMQDGRCFSYLDNILWASLMYLSYLFLFLSFFYQTYIKGGSRSSKKTIKAD
ncbi:Elongation of very long chain fatty acids protein 6 [Acipenser ruthenus]|uniref:Elongation of very long chain fatty acids protein n=1 Tax=Acipenser ruthenus TaxID=7906 RepID=A0A444U3Q3_ACIRT|nr:Elongation of very long chain fatty acids protein 6 [Acipenser ruthenus]